MPVFLCSSRNLSPEASSGHGDRVRLWPSCGPTWGWKLAPDLFISLSRGASLAHYHKSTVCQQKGLILCGLSLLLCKMGMQWRSKHFLTPFHFSEHTPHPSAEFTPAVTLTHGSLKVGTPQSSPCPCLISTALPRVSPTQPGQSKMRVRRERQEGRGVSGGELEAACCVHARSCASVHVRVSSPPSSVCLCVSARSG